MPNAKKIFVIIHLIFAFTYLSWLILQPAFKEALFQKSKKALFDEVIGNTTYFEMLPHEEQACLIVGAKKVIKGDFRIQTSILSFGWFLFSLVICLLLLFEIEGASLAIWILPFLVFLQFFFIPNTQTMSAFQCDQQSPKEVVKAWKHHLIVHYAKEVPSESAFDLQVEKGFYLFNVMRAQKLMLGEGKEELVSFFFVGSSFLLLSFSFLWNLIFAWKMKSSKLEAAFSQS